MHQQWNRFADRLGTLLLSVVLALIIWLIATNQQNPVIQDLFSDPLAVSIRGLTGSVEPIQDLSDVQVRVTVRSPEQSWGTLDANDFSAYIDLTGLAPGEYNVPVQATVVDPQVEIVSVQPSELRVQLDEVLDKELVIDAVASGVPAPNYIALAPIAVPITVTVSGPATLVDQVTQARASIRLDDAKSQVVDEMAPVTLLDAQGSEVLQVDVDPAIVKVIVPIEQAAGRKEVAVRPNLEGAPANGYRLGAVRVTPSTVVLEGDSDALDEVPGFVETAELSLADASESVDQRIALILPDGVTAQEGNTVVISAEVTPVEAGKTLEQEPVIQGLEPGLEARVALDTVEVILSGPQPLLESMEPDDMFVILDLSGLLPGSHAVEPRVVLPDGITKEGILPEIVEVVITTTALETPSLLDGSEVVTSTVTPAIDSIPTSSP
jgi:YbbR domain-containing protein